MEDKSGQRDARRFEPAQLGDTRGARILPEHASGAPYREEGGRVRAYEPEGSSGAVRNAPGETAGPEDHGDRGAGSKPRRGGTTCLIVSGTVLLLVLSCGLLAYASLRDGLGSLGRLSAIIPSVPLRTPTVTIDTSRPAVVDQVRSLGKLESVHYELEKVVSGKSTGPLPDFLTSDRILLVAHGQVVAGVDLTKILPTNISVISGSVTITMPAPEILYTKLDNDKTYVYDRQTGIFSKPDPNLETQVRQAGEREILQAAEEDGILTKASENARQVLQSLVGGLGYKEVTIKEGP